MVCVGQADRENEVSRTHIEGWMDQASDVELLQRHFAAFLNFGFIFPVF